VLNNQVHETRARSSDRPPAAALRRTSAFRFANGFSPSGTATSSTTSDRHPRDARPGPGGFYDATGAYKDMVVTHLFQVMAFVAMDR
jgi:glucose-6-phosphate 1-dehydrogenase